MENKEEKIENIEQLIKTKREEINKLNEELFELTKDDEVELLKQKYLGRYYKHDQGAWKNYIFVNNLRKEDNTLECVELTIVDYVDGDFESYYEQIDTKRDFSCHYISQYSHDHKIDECVEITKEEFEAQYIVWLSRVNDKIIGR